MQHDSDGRCSEASGNQCSNANSNHEVDESDADSDDNGIDSDTPSNFNASDHLFHINFLRTLQHMPTDIKRWDAILFYFLLQSIYRSKNSILDSKMARDEAVRLQMNKCDKSNERIAFCWRKYWVMGHCGHSDVNIRRYCQKHDR